MDGKSLSHHSDRTPTPTVVRKIQTGSKRKKTKMKIVASSLLVAIGLCLLLHGLTTMALVKVVQAEHIAYISLASEDRFGSSVLVVSGTFLMIVGSILTIKATRKYLNR